MTSAETQFAVQLVQEAKLSGHLFPGYAAAEAFLESASWDSPSGMSSLAANYHNIFGQKKSSWWAGPTTQIQTREVLNGVSVMVPATWPVFASFAEAFEERLKLLHSLPEYYSDALAATSGSEFVRLVSASWGTLNETPYPVGAAHPQFTFPSGTYQFAAGRWSTAPNRASSVLQTYNSHLDIFGVWMAYSEHYYYEDDPEVATVRLTITPKEGKEPSNCIHPLRMIKYALRFVERERKNLADCPDAYGVYEDSE
jgi:hypothetical protein